MSLGIILIHGYSGSPTSLDPLANELIIKLGKDSVTNLTLPRHDTSRTPEYNEDLFIETIHQSIETYQKENRKIVVIGHSTGGVLALSTLDQFSFNPALLVLVSVPKKIDGAYWGRWDSHQVGRDSIALVDVAMMVKSINSTGSIHFQNKFPVLIIHGEDDKLVLCSEAHAWKRENFPNTSRVVTIPNAGHDIFHGPNNQLAMDLVMRSITDLSFCDDDYSETIHSFVQTEPQFKPFFEETPFGNRHLALSPSGQRVLGEKLELEEIAKNDPIIANIEITTYCNLKCQFCARTQLHQGNQHMSFELFQNILGMLPNLYKIVLVGLGEPLMHPQILDFIRYAKSLKKKVGFVTNAMLLTPDISHQLLAAGLDSIVFSIDGYDADTSSLVRTGTNFARVIANIKKFVKNSNSSRRISKAVFSAVSLDTVAHLQELVDLILDLGVDVLMLSDVNFLTNLDHTLWKNVNDPIEDTVRKAVAYAFSKNLPVLSVRGLEEFGLEERYHQFLMIPPSQLYQRSKNHTWCCSPWQTVPIDVQGQVTLCDCQPEFAIGNLLSDPFSKIWNGEMIKKYRAEMLSEKPPEACKLCPRF